MPIENTSLNISSIKRIARGRLRGHWKAAFIPAFLITLMTGIPALFDGVSRSIVWVNLMMDDSWMNAADVTQIINTVNSVQLTGPASILNSLLSLFSFLCGGALSVSMAALALKIIRREEYSSSTAFAGFSQFARAFIISLLIMIFSFLWGMVTILPAAVVFSVGLVMESAIMAILGTIILITALIGYILIILRYSMSYFIASDDPVIPASHVTANSVFLMRRRTGNFFLLELSFIGWLLLAAIPMAIGITLITSGYAAGIGGVILLGVILCAVSMVPLAFVSLYITTAEAVYYSTITGNYNVNASAGPAGQGGAGPAGQGGARPAGQGGARPAGQGGARPVGQGGVETSGEYVTGTVGQVGLETAVQDNPGTAALGGAGQAGAESAAPDSAEAPAEPAPAVIPEAASHGYFPDSLSSENPYDPDPAPPADSDRV